MKKTSRPLSELESRLEEISDNLTSLADSSADLSSDAPRSTLSDPEVVQRAMVRVAERAEKLRELSQVLDQHIAWADSEFGDSLPSGNLVIAANSKFRQMLDLQLQQAEAYLRRLQKLI